MTPSTRRPILLLAAAFAAVYVIWGSTYLAIRFGIETIPPFLMGGGRWIAAGAVLFTACMLTGSERPKAIHWRSALIVGTLLMFGGNGLVSFAEQWVDSGLTALLIATVPVWIVGIEAVRTRTRPGTWVIAGIAGGLVGVAFLVGDALSTAVEGMTLVGILVILFACVSWASGSLYSRRAPLPKSLLLGASMEMLAGGAVLTVVGVATGEASRLDVGAISATSWWAVLYLAVFGSIVAYSAYVWLLKTTSPTNVATYAFVNPGVAVLLGWWLANERVTPTSLAAAGLIVASVALIVWGNGKRTPAQPKTGGPSPRETV